MLDREEERRLAEIEARLRVEDPALHELFAKAPAQGQSGPRGHDRAPEPPPEPEPTESDQPYILDGDDEPGPRHPSHLPSRRWDDGPAFDAELAKPPGVVTSIVRTLAAIMAAVALTAVVTLILGANIGGFVSVVAFCLAGMYGYQTIRGCPGLRRARGQD